MLMVAIATMRDDLRDNILTDERTRSGPRTDLVEEIMRLQGVRRQTSACPELGERRGISATTQAGCRLRWQPDKKIKKDKTPDTLGERLKSSGKIRVSAPTADAHQGTPSESRTHAEERTSAWQMKRRKYEFVLTYCVRSPSRLRSRFLGLGCRTAQQVALIGRFDDFSC